MSRLFEYVEPKYAGERRRPHAITEIIEDPHQPRVEQIGMVQKRYILEVKIRTSFLANAAQLEFAKKAAKIEAQHFFHKDTLDLLPALNRAIEEMDQNELRHISHQIRATMIGDN